MPLPYSFDWKNPDYNWVFRYRVKHLEAIRQSPQGFAPLIRHYRVDPIQMIIDWGVTFDPRNAPKGLPTLLPFVLYPKQEEWLGWILDRWRKSENGLTEKSRGAGVSWLAVALACTLGTLYRGVVVGFGSRKQEYVDDLGNPKSLLEKARIYMQWLPEELRAGWLLKKHAPHMQLIFPHTGSAIGGEVGDSIGRGDRTSLYFVDEAAFLEHPAMADYGLMGTTNCRQDISTPNGMANSFAQKRFSGKVPIFTFHWKFDPRYDEQWYEEQKAKATDDVMIKQELDVSYTGSVDGIVIESDWIMASIDAHIKLGIQPTGNKRGALDVADEGADKNALIGRHGILVEHAESWSGKGSDTYKTTMRAVNICDDKGYESFDYDADGMGPFVRGDVNAINEKRTEESKRHILCNPFRGSATGDGMFDPEGIVPGTGRTNKDYFLNLKAQSWWSLRIRFRNTYRAVVEKMEVDLDEIISLDSTLPELPQLILELSQPVYVRNEVGKIKIEKKPEGTRSPNLADGVMMVFNPLQRTADVWQRIAERV